MGFAAIATDLDTGEEVVLDRGRLTEVVRASISVPGLLAPSHHAGRFLVDGGVVNPLPFDVARHRFGGPVLAVGVHSGARGLTRHDMNPERSGQWADHVRQLLQQPWMGPLEPLRIWLETQLENGVVSEKQKEVWRVRAVLDQMLAITQAQIVRLRTLDTPPDILLVPDVGRIDMLEFYRGAEAVAAGRRVVREQLPQIRALLEQ
jgi:NTE family protein